MQLNKVVIFLLNFASYSVSAVNPFLDNIGYDAEHFIYYHRPEWLTKAWDITTDILEGRKAKEDRVYGKSCVKMIISSIKYTRAGSTSNKATARVNQCYCGIFLGDSINSPGVAEDAITVLDQVANTIDKHGMPTTGYIQEKTAGVNQSKIFGIAVHCEDDGAWVEDKMAHFENSKLGPMTCSII